MRTLVLLFSLAAALHATNYYVTVAGLGGTPEYEAQFKKWAADIDQSFRSNGPGSQVETLTGAAATREHLTATLSRLASQVTEDDSLALMLIGHGSFDGTDYKFNIPGPDISATELDSLLNRIAARRQLVAVMTSASGAAFRELGKNGRIVITATKSGTEKNATVFARYWVDALRDPAADTDKNGTVSALEAFRYAQRKTAAYFESQKLLATEHATLNGSGSQKDANGERTSGGKQDQLASAFVLIRPPTEAAAASSPQKQRLLSRKEDLEAKIDKLKYQKAAMPADEYKRELTTLLLELAKTQAEIDR
jgi:hypothetical protein